jgi:hypothetical protein
LRLRVTHLRSTVVEAIGVIVILAAIIIVIFIGAK